MLIRGAWIVFLLASSAALAVADENSAAKKTVTSPSHLETIVLTVDKTNLKAELRTWPQDFASSGVLHSFRIAIGKAIGDKEKEGDNKTPEGIYFTQQIIDDAELPSKYGPKAIPLNFPNPIDHLDGKTGHGIWLHGAGDDDRRIEASNVTEGCVAFYNADIVRLTRWLKPYQGIVVITADMSQINRPDEMRAVTANSLDWASAWAARDMDRYISHYSDKFSYNGGGAAAYKDYKSRVFKSYKEMTVKTDHVRVITHPKYAVTVMNQDFFGDKRFKSIGRKVLYWHKNTNGSWQISREIFEDRRVEPLEFSDAELTALTNAAVSKQNAGLDKPAGSNL